MTTKSRVLGILECSRGEYISGQELSKRLGVSRTAIWKAIRALEQDGHKITAARRGYRLDAEHEKLSLEGILACLPDGYSYAQIHCYDEIDSTNAEAKRIMSGAAHGTLLAADYQTAGRGRFGKSFYSPKGTGLYMSIILRPDDADISDVQMITVAAAVVVSEVIEGLTGLAPKIKWVNDLYLNGKKICGILTEAVSNFESGQVESIVVGIGINCATSDFPAELSGIAGSLGVSTLSHNRLAAEILDGIVKVFKNMNDPEIIEKYKSRSFIIGKDITYTRAGTEQSATVLDINDRGNLVVRGADGSTGVISSGEVSIKGWGR